MTGPKTLIDTKNEEFKDNLKFMTKSLQKINKVKENSYRGGIKNFDRKITKNKKLLPRIRITNIFLQSKLLFSFSLFDVMYDDFLKIK